DWMNFTRLARKALALKEAVEIHFEQDPSKILDMELLLVYLDEVNAQENERLEIGRIFNFPRAMQDNEESNRKQQIKKTVDQYHSEKTKERMEEEADRAFRLIPVGREKVGFGQELNQKLIEFASHWGGYLGRILAVLWGVAIAGLYWFSRRSREWVVVDDEGVIDERRTRKGTTYSPPPYDLVAPEAEVQPAPPAWSRAGLNFMPRKKETAEDRHIRIVNLPYERNFLERWTAGSVRTGSIFILAWFLLSMPFATYGIGQSILDHAERVNVLLAPWMEKVLRANVPSFLDQLSNANDLSFWTWLGMMLLIGGLALRISMVMTDYFWNWIKLLLPTEESQWRARVLPVISPEERSQAADQFKALHPSIISTFMAATTAFIYIVYVMDLRVSIIECLLFIGAPFVFITLPFRYAGTLSALSHVTIEISRELPQQFRRLFYSPPTAPPTAPPRTPAPAPVPAPTPPPVRPAPSQGITEAHSLGGDAYTLRTGRSALRYQSIALDPMEMADPAAVGPAFTNIETSYLNSVARKTIEFKAKEFWVDEVSPEFRNETRERQQELIQALVGIIKSQANERVKIKRIRGVIQDSRLMGGKFGLSAVAVQNWIQRRPSRLNPLARLALAKVYDPRRKNRREITGEDLDPYDHHKIVIDSRTKDKKALIAEIEAVMGLMEKYGEDRVYYFHCILKVGWKWEQLQQVKQYLLGGFKHMGTYDQPYYDRRKKDASARAAQFGKRKNGFYLEDQIDLEFTDEEDTLAGILKKPAQKPDGTQKTKDGEPDGAPVFVFRNAKVQTNRYLMDPRNGKRYPIFDRKIYDEGVTAANYRESLPLVEDNLWFWNYETGHISTIDREPLVGRRVRSDGTMERVVFPQYMDQATEQFFEVEKADESGTLKLYLKPNGNIVRASEDGQNEILVLKPEQYESVKRQMLWRGAHNGILYEDKTQSPAEGRPLMNHLKMATTFTVTKMGFAGIGETTVLLQEGGDEKRKLPIKDLVQLTEGDMINKDYDKVKYNIQKFDAGTFEIVNGHLVLKGEVVTRTLFVERYEWKAREGAYVLEDYTDEHGEKKTDTFKPGVDERGNVVRYPQGVYRITDSDGKQVALGAHVATRHDIYRAAETRAKKPKTTAVVADELRNRIRLFVDRELQKEQESEVSLEQGTTDVRGSFLVDQNNKLVKDPLTDKFIRGDYRGRNLRADVFKPMFGLPQGNEEKKELQKLFDSAETKGQIDRPRVNTFKSSGILGNIYKMHIGKTGYETTYLIRKEDVSGLGLNNERG
ncbi:MAG: hypothetical protein HY586_00300, partial [Candidatus Omnitrophica bacterium]|nr:hypothetical protein [Candidatus Omnitrophota bacterium]